MFSMTPWIKTHSKPLHQTPLQKPAVAEPLIFVVEDDGRIRRFVCSILKYATKALIIGASNPEAAIKMARAIGRPVDLLISDIDLGADKSGVDVAREIGRENPSMKVLLMSGGEFPQCDVPAEWRFIGKPFPIATFLNCVNELFHSLQAEKLSGKSVKSRAAA